MTHSENALLRDAADVVNAIALLSKVYEDGSTPLMASLDGGRVIACIEALTARVSELARAHACALEENARLTRECEFHAKQCARVDELRHRAEAELAALREQIAERDAELAALKAHAEAMASVLYRIRLYSNEDAVVEAYRTAYPKEIDA